MQTTSQTGNRVGVGDIAAQSSLSFSEMSPACFRPVFDEIMDACFDGGAKERNKSCHNPSAVCHRRWCVL
jgi:hypothetical protein